MTFSARFFSIVLAIAGISACGGGGGSNSAGKNGSVVFFHNIQGSPELRLDAIDEKDRNGYGSAVFETFGTVISLRPRSWSLEVVDAQGTEESVDDQTILEDAEFTVEAKKLGLVALTGTYDTSLPASADLRVHVLPIAEDTERDDRKNDSDYEQELVQFINFSHLDKDLGPVNIYLVKESQSTDNLALLTPIVTGLAFGDSTDDIRIERLATEYADYYLRISLASAPTVEIFNSGEQRLYDYRKQTLLISPNYSGVGASALVAFYYGDGYTRKWFDKDDNIGALRVFNGLRDSVDLAAVADNVVDDAYDRTVDTGMAFGEVSAFVTDVVADVDTYVLKSTEGATPVSTMVPVDVGSADYWTVVLYGRIADAAGIPVKETLNANGSQASITFTNAAYFADSDDIIPFNVHIKKASETLADSSISIEELDPGSYGHLLKTAGTYQIYVTKLNNNVIDYLSVDLAANTNYHFVIVEDVASFSGYAIVALPTIP